MSTTFYAVKNGMRYTLGVRSKMFRFECLDWRNVIKDAIVYDEYGRKYTERQFLCAEVGVHYNTYFSSEPPIRCYNMYEAIKLLASGETMTKDIGGYFRANEI